MSDEFEKLTAKVKASLAAELANGTDACRWATCCIVHAYKLLKSDIKRKDAAAKMKGFSYASDEEMEALEEIVSSYSPFIDEIEQMAVE